MIPVVLPWALGAAYPAGPYTWSSALTKVQPTPDDYFTPNKKPVAQFWNYLLNAHSASLWYAQGDAQGFAAQNWGALFGLGSQPIGAPIAFEAACWSPLDAQWWVALHASGLNGIALLFKPPTIDSAWNFVNPGGILTTPVRSGNPPNQNFVAIAPDPTRASHIWLGVVTSQTHCGVWLFDGTTFRGSTSINVGTGQATVVMHTFNGHVIIGVGSTGGDEARLFLQPDNTNVLSFAIAKVWRFADNGSSFCVALPGYTVGAQTYWTSPDGVTWQPHSIFFLNQGEQIFGVCYTEDEWGPCWVAGINTPTIFLLRPTAPRFVKSVDGLTWTPQSSFTQTTPGVDMCSLGGTCIVVSTVDGAYTPFSVDGGVTWYPAWEASLATNNSPAIAYAPPTVCSSDVGYLLFNSTSIRLSLLQGLPAASM